MVFLWGSIYKMEPTQDLSAGNHFVGATLWGHPFFILGQAIRRCVRGTHPTAIFSSFVNESD